MVSTTPRLKSISTGQPGNVHVNKARFGDIVGTIPDASQITKPLDVLLRTAMGAIYDHRNANTLATHFGHPDRIGGVDGDARRLVPRAARVLSTAERKVPPSPAAQVLLPVYLRVLLQPLCGRVLPVAHRI